MTAMVMLLAGCTTETAAPTPAYQSVVAGLPADAGPAVSATSTGTQRLTLRTFNPPSGAAPRTCTADLSPTKSAVQVPADIDPSESLTVVIDDRTLVLPGRRQP